MTDLFEIESLRRRLRALMDAKDIRPTSLSLSIGKNPSLIADLLEKTNDVKLSTLFKIASHLDIPINHLLLPEYDPIPAGPKVFLKGEVAAGQWSEAYEWQMDDWREMTGSPDVSVDPKHRFFLRVVGDSMNQVYPDGSFIECVSIFSGIEVLAGNKVVVLRKRYDGFVEATVKEYVENNGEKWLVPKSFNPSHQAFRVDDPGDAIEEVSIIAVVVSAVIREAGR